MPPAPSVSQSTRTSMIWRLTTQLFHFTIQLAPSPQNRSLRKPPAMFPGEPEPANHVQALEVCFAPLAPAPHNVIAPIVFDVQFPDNEHVVVPLAFAWHYR